MLSGNALRHQIIMPEQQKFYDYWRSKCRAGQFPSREDILPEEVFGTSMSAKFKVAMSMSCRLETASIIGTASSIKLSTPANPMSASPARIRPMGRI